jgi:hypothetical protein
MTDFTSNLFPSGPTFALQGTSRLKRLVPGTVIFFALTLLAGALLTGALARTAFTLMQHDSRPGMSDVFEGRVRLKTLDPSFDDNRVAALMPAPVQ